MTAIQDVPTLSSVLPEQQQRISSLMGKLLYDTDQERLKHISELVDMIDAEEREGNHGQAFREYSALFMDSLITLLTGGKSSHRSTLFEFMDLLNFLPISPKHRRYTLLKAALDPYLAEYPDVYERFDQYQALLLLTRLGDYENGARLLDELADGVDISRPQVYLIYHLAKARVLYQQERYLEFVGHWLDLIPRFYQTDSADLAVYLLIVWSRIMNWQNDSMLLKALLEKISRGLSHQQNLNMAMATYDRFCLENRLVGPDDKIQLAERLIKRFSSHLSSRQLQELHFFAGNYSSGMRSSFLDSIQYFKYSNYYLNRCWNEQTEGARFLRGILSPEHFCMAMPYIEKRIQVMGNQVSMHNNSYVESLQADYSKIESLLQQVEDLSITDSLTGLRNRRFLEVNIYQLLLLATRQKAPISFAMLDIDHFKKVNDTWGHQAGDQVLKELACILSEEFRKSDVIIRYGGEEFLMILFDSPLDSTLVKMEVLRAKVEAHPFSYKGRVFHLTVSIGINRNNIVIYNEQDIRSGIEIADAALYKAKNDGRNQVRVV
ncbi:MAG TPA: GGDEF domain-containing protein [Candidatus Cloacimonadota bacterium]|nr:GGDEF domain-containing protein [Candidatus Cloacimonadota bacterium]